MPAGGWMEVGRLQTDQTGVPVGYKRCSQRVDPRCIDKDGIFPVEDYRIIRPHAPTPRIAFCRFCDSYKRSKHAQPPDEQDAYLGKRRRQMEEIRSRMGRRAVYAYEVLYDPTDTYQRGALFQLQDFNMSLEASVWPTGLMIRDISTAQCYSVWVDQLVGIEDRDWFAYRREMLDG